MRKAEMAVLVVLIVLLGCASGFCQSCRVLYALNTQSLAVDPEGSGGWNLVPGTTKAIFNWQEFSPDFIEYVPGNAAYPSAVAGRYWDFKQVWHFVDKNSKQEIGTFTITHYRASFPLPAGKAGMGTLNGGGDITSGTGIFEGVTGTLNETGPYIVWFGEDGWTYGQYNATYTARLCTR